MPGRDIAPTISEVLTPLAGKHALELVDVEIAGMRQRPIVRIYLDREGGIDIDTIAESNRWISDAIEDAGVIPGPYTLEVSSPGIERPLKRLADYERFAGETAYVRTDKPIEGRSRFTGDIVRVEGDTVVLDVDGAEVRIAFSAIVKAKLKPEIVIGDGRSEEA